MTARHFMLIGENIVQSVHTRKFMADVRRVATISRFRSTGISIRERERERESVSERRTNGRYLTSPDLAALD